MVPEAGKSKINDSSFGVWGGSFSWFAAGHFVAVSSHGEERELWFLPLLISVLLISWLYPQDLT